MFQVILNKKVIGKFSTLQNAKIFRLDFLIKNPDYKSHSLTINLILH